LYFEHHQHTAACCLVFEAPAMPLLYRLGALATWSEGKQSSEDEWEKVGKKWRIVEKMLQCFDAVMQASIED